MSTWVVQVVIVVLFALMCGALAAAWMHGRLGVAAIGLFAAALGLWIAAVVAITQEFHGANNFATCQDECTPIHYVSAVAFIAAPLLIALSAVGMLVSRGSRWRERRAAHENHG